MTTTGLPGYRVVESPRTVAEDGLRNDVAAFLGSTPRGPLGVAVRIEGRQAYAATFGGPGPGTVPRAVAAYFSNGGQVAWIVRAGIGGRTASADLILGPITAEGEWTVDGPRRTSFPGAILRVTATSPGTWANGIQIKIGYSAYGRAGAPELDVTVEPPDAPALRAAGLTAAEAADVLTGSGVVAASYAGGPVTGRPGDTAGPARLRWSVTLTGGADPEVTAAALRAAIGTQAQVEEIALVCVPDLTTVTDARDVLPDLAASAASSQDRLAVVTIPAVDAASLAEWSGLLAEVGGDPALGRAVAAYTPWLLAEDPAPTGPDRYVPTDPAGHVCGRISELDRERGSGWSPANTLVSDAVDTTAEFPADVQALALGRGINLLRRRVGGGLELWGARTLDPGPGRYVAHRRLVHRIVRAARRVVAPLVFDTNDHLLRLSVVRAVSGLLLEAFRSGSLRGATPDEAYRVRCDETTNPPDVIDAGLLVCEIEVAPATPMEFITLRLTIGAEGLLEVVEQ